MAFCENCGEKLEEGAKFCSECGATVEIGETLINNQYTGQVPERRTVKQETATDYQVGFYTDQEIQSGRLMGILAYFGIFVLIPFFVEKNNRFVRYHVKQGMTLLAATVILMIISMFFLIFAGISFEFMLFSQFLLAILNMMIAIFSIIGIINVIKGKAKPIPIIGNIQIIK